jgi:hypothetical protein
MEETEALLADRIDNLSLSGGRDSREFVYAIDLLRAVSWCKSVEIQMSLARVLARSSNPEIVQACFAGKLVESEALHEKLLEVLALLPGTGKGLLGSGYSFIWDAYKLDGTGAEDIFERFVSRSAEDAQSACIFFQVSGHRPVWAERFLMSLLADMRSTEYYYESATGAREILVRDEAAVALSVVRNSDQLGKPYDALRSTGRGY